MENKIIKSIEEIDNESFMLTGLGEKSLYFKKYETVRASYVSCLGKIYEWNFALFMKAREEITKEYGLVSNRGVADWIVNGGLALTSYTEEEIKKESEAYHELQAKLKEIAKVIYNFEAELENACDNLYYGYCFTSWYTRQANMGSTMCLEEAKIIWQEAINRMSKDN